MIAALIGLVLPIGATWLGLRALGLRRASDSTAVTGAVACGLGLALATVGTFATLIFGGHLSPVYAAVDASVWLMLGTVAWRRLRREAAADRSVQTRQAPAPLDRLDWCVRGTFVAVALLAVAVPIVEYLAAPHGQWDAWAMWNQKARFMFRAGPGWTALLALTWAQPGHPLFVALSVARVWAYAGTELTVVPAALSLVYGIALVALVMGALDTGTRRAWVAGAVLVAPFTFSHLVAAQTADLPLTLFVTASLVMLRRLAVEPRDATHLRGTLVLAGVLGGCAAWTKNEGFVFLAVSSALVAWLTLRHGRLRDAAWWLGAALPLVAVVLWFKLAFATGSPEYFAAREGGPGGTPRILDGERLRALSSMTATFWWRWGGSMATGALVVTALASIGAILRPANGADRGLLAVAAVMVAGYYVVWVVSPMDTTWLVATTFDRLMAQVWPTLVLVAASGRRLAA